MSNFTKALERVARALCKRDGVDPDDLNGGAWDGGSYPAGKPAWQSWTDDARTAIEALVDPTDEMVMACVGGDPDRPGPSPRIIREIWRTMIERALGK